VAVDDHRVLDWRWRKAAILFSPQAGDNPARRVALPEIRQKLIELGIVARASTPEKLKGLLADEIVKWSDVVARAKIEQQ
jgi:hypothetical protein